MASTSRPLCLLSASVCLAAWAAPAMGWAQEGVAEPVEEAADGPAPVEKDGPAPVEKDAPADGPAPVDKTAPPAEPAPSDAATPTPEPFKPMGWGALPALNYNTDEGFGYGVIGRLYWYDEEKMAFQPYSKALTLRIFLTTKWVQAHLVELDALDFAGLPLRLRLRGALYSTVVDNFCGVGDSVTCDPELASQEAIDYLGLPISDPSEVDTLSAEDQAAYNEISRLYYYQRYTEPYLWVDTRTKLKELPHKVEVMASWRGSAYGPGTFQQPYSYPGSLLEANPELQPDGFASVLQAGIMFDNRDFEPSPSRGYWVEASVRGSHRAIGSDWDYLGANVILRGYQSILPDGKLVLADRVILDGMWGDMPVTELARVGGSSIFTAYGGQNAGRGIRSARYLGRLKAFNQTELRWNVHTFNTARNRFDIGTLAFVDLGMVGVDWDDWGGDHKVLPGTGGGLRVGWNRNFIVRVDVGVSPIEDWTPRVYINLDHLF